MNLYTPITAEAVKASDRLPAIEAVVKAWSDPGRVPTWHYNAKDRVRSEMPLLARALDRLVNLAEGN